jgi:murein DD-endopeptidase MepM/ murein hydrolase activator NlpD
MAAAGVDVSRSSGTPLTLPPVAAAGLHLDTLLLGGYASGSFSDAVRSLASDLSAEERTLVGRHLDRIFADVLSEGGLGRNGRLRVAYERALRPDGTARSIRVLGAEVAVRGRLHTAFYYEKGEQPGYYDPFGRPLEASAWNGPLRRMTVSSPFGARRLHPILDQVLPHTGVDLAAPVGEPVVATAEGVIAGAAHRGGYGLMVEIHHPSGYSTRYAHLSRLEEGVAPGKAVRQGETIGYVGMTGLATGPHLHYEVRRRGQPIDPLRVTGDPDLSADIAGEPRWAAERRDLGALLARTPTVRQRS